MRNRSNKEGGCGLIFLCLLVIVAVGKCGGGETLTVPRSDPPESSSASSIEPTPMYVATATLNCRAEPDAGARMVEKLGRGDLVSAGETRGNWVSLDRSGEDCWVAARFLSESEPDPARQAARLYSPPADTLETLSSPRSSGPSCGTKWKCGQMDSCSEAYHYLNECGLGRLDGDGDGVPCESIC